MAILPAQEAHRLITRRRLTLDLFTRYGPFWEHIAAMRGRWDVTPRCRVPPEPTFHVESIGLMDRDHMPERFHLPELRPDKPLYNMPAWALAELSPVLAAMVAERPDWIRTSRFLTDIESIWKHFIPDDARSGTNAMGFLSWAPFLSACLLYDPPRDELLAYADHDDHDAAALPHQTFNINPGYAVAADRARQSLWIYNDPAEWTTSVILDAGSFRESTPAPIAARPRGKPALDDLEAVQAALWFRDGLSYLEVAERGGWHEHAESTDSRKRKNPAMSRVKRGDEVLICREYSG